LGETKLVGLAFEGGDVICGVEGAAWGGGTPSMLVYALRTLELLRSTLLSRMDSGGSDKVTVGSGMGTKRVGRSTFESHDLMMDSPFMASTACLVKMWVSMALFLGERNTV